MRRLKPVGLCDDYKHAEYKEHADYFFGLVEILMDAAKENESIANFSEIKLEELISNVSSITDLRAKEIYKFLRDCRTKIYLLNNNNPKNQKT